MSDVSELAQNNWHLDKRVNISVVVTFIIGLLGQGAYLVWFAGKIDSRVTVLETRTATLESSVIPVAPALAAIKTSQDDMRRSLDRIERTIDGQRGK